MFQQRRSAIALRHVAFEDLGLLAPIMERTGWNVSFCEAAVDDLTHPSIRTADLLIVLGGPIGVYETESYPFITDEIALIERRLRQGLPTLGICLGAQLMAKALGSRVYAGHVKEIGWGTISLTEEGATSCLKSLDRESSVLHWHGDTFDLPAQAKRLARTPITRTRLSATASTPSPCSFISKPSRANSRNGMSATPSNSRQPKYRSPNSARRHFGYTGRSHLHRLATPDRPARHLALAKCKRKVSVVVGRI
jgi:GMP synthase-like glutamine amidotransferase